MSEIIFVEPDGESHTIDQIHKEAILINKIIDGTLGEALRKLKKAFIQVWEHIKESLKPVIAAMLKMQQTVAGRMEELTKYFERDTEKRGIREWQRNYHKVNAECRLKRKLKQQTSFIQTKDWRSSRRSRHRRGTSKVE